MTTQWITDVEAMLAWFKAHDVPSPEPGLGCFDIICGSDVAVFRKIVAQLGEHEKAWTGTNQNIALAIKTFGSVKLEVHCSSDELLPPVTAKPIWNIETDQQSCLGYAGRCSWVFAAPLIDKIMPKKKQHKCSFCGRPSQDVHKLVVSKSTGICNGCASICCQIFMETPKEQIKGVVFARFVLDESAEGIEEFLASGERGIPIT